MSVPGSLMDYRYTLTICAGGVFPYLCCLPPGHTGWHRDPGLDAAWSAAAPPPGPEVHAAIPRRAGLAYRTTRRRDEAKKEAGK